MINISISRLKEHNVINELEIDGHANYAEYGEDIYIYKVDVDREPDVARAFGIQSVPSLLFIPQGASPQMGQGNIPMASLKKVIDEFLLGKEPKE